MSPRGSENAVRSSGLSSIIDSLRPIDCRRQIEKSPLAQKEMSLSTVLVGEFWADDGDCDEPDGDRPDERVAGSSGGQSQGNGSRDVDGSRPASGVPAGEGLPSARACSAGFAETGPAEQPLLPCGSTRYGDCDHPGAVPRLRTDAGGREAGGASRHLPSARDGSPMDDRSGSVEGSPCPFEAGASAALPARMFGRANPDRWIGALVVREPRAALYPARLH